MCRDPPRHLGVAPPQRNFHDAKAAPSALWAHARLASSSTHPRPGAPTSRSLCMHVISCKWPLPLHFTACQPTAGWHPLPTTVSSPKGDACRSPHPCHTHMHTPAAHVLRCCAWPPHARPAWQLMRFTLRSLLGLPASTEGGGGGVEGRQALMVLAGGLPTATQTTTAATWHPSHGRASSLQYWDMPKCRDRRQRMCVPTSTDVYMFKANGHGRYYAK